MIGKEFPSRRLIDDESPFVGLINSTCPTEIRLNLFVCCRFSAPPFLSLSRAQQTELTVAKHENWADGEKDSSCLCSLFFSLFISPFVFGIFRNEIIESNGVGCLVPPDVSSSVGGILLILMESVLIETDESVKWRKKPTLNDKRWNVTHRSARGSGVFTLIEY